MPTAEDYEERDHAFVREEIFSPDWTPDPLPSTAWRGIVQDGEYLVPDPQPTTSGDPTVSGAWDLVYDELAGDYGGEAAPVRYGRLRVTGLIQKGAMMGHMRRFFRAVRKQIGAAPEDSPLDFNVQTAKPVPLGNVGPWRVFMVEFPFCGG